MVWFLVLGISSVRPVHAQRLTLRGEAAAAATVNDVAPRSTYLSARYVPELFAEIALPDGASLDALGSLDASATARVVSWEESESDGEVDLYRLWLRYRADQFESRVGLQKITFGSATLLRPLMWFDRLDPRDPLQITEGVYALLLRYYFLNNANLWFWGLLGNDEPKGWELLPSSRWDPEIGGRVQVPISRGEAALSFHYRRADAEAIVPPGPLALESSFPEHRIALDGKWDVTVGLWFEAVLIHQRSALLERPYQRLMVVGTDYTFGLGEGLTVLGEHFVADSAVEAFGSGDGSSTSALSARYRWGVVDELSAILDYDWKQGELFKFATWRRTYDRWAFHVLVFANPSEPRFSPVQPRSGLLAGTGIQVLVSYHH